MFRRTFKIVFKPLKNNFVVVPENYFNLISSYENGCLSLSTDKLSHYVTWTAYPGNIRDTDIGINAKVATELGLKEFDLIKCSLVTDIVSLRAVHATPLTSSDWEIIELSTDRIQSTLLDQTRIINSCQNLVIWVNRSMQVKLAIDRMKPNVSFGRLENDTELIIAPRLQNFRSIINNESLSNYELAKSKTKNKILPRVSKLERSVSTNINNNNKNFLKNNSGIIKAANFERLKKDLKRENHRTFEFRVISGKWEGPQISDLYLTRSNLPEFMDLEKVFLLKTINGDEYNVNVKLIAETESFPNNIYKTIEINENLMKLLKIKELDKITLCPKETILNFLEKIELFPSKQTNYKIIEQAFKLYINDNTKLFPILLNQNQIIRLESDLFVTIKITPEHFQYCLIDSQILKECKLYAADQIIKVDDLIDIENVENNILMAKDLINIPTFDEIVSRIVEEIKLNLCLDSRSTILRQGNYLIAGPSNSGKTVLIEKILSELEKKPFCVHYEIFYCTRNKGRKVESIQKDLRQVFNSALVHAPSIIVLENLDVLAHYVGDQQTSDGEYFNRVADVIQHIVTEYITNNSISIIASISNVQHLNGRLYGTHGRHTFHKCFNVPSLQLKDRQKILEDLRCHIDVKDLDLKKFSELTEGYMIGDLVQLFEKGIFYAYRINTVEPVLTNELLAKSLEQTNSYCLSGIKSNQVQISGTSSNTNINIPGLENVLIVLEEVLLWPTMYDKIFAKSPIRNQAGVLLFGPPGTGKTFLVNQIAQSWNLRLICIKGPELLAKYIGQSEENVRNLFNRARNAKPCVLFFDEFDSLAPKRGHDSTGVTDRVVNQLLTELDGVEGLQGVTVIAATSRPDLLDPALLRSGRIDRLVQCELPDCSARSKIFEFHSNSMKLDKSVNFSYFVQKTDKYTGADILSILTTSRMKAVKEVLEKNDNEIEANDILLTQDHLLEAFKETRPSLSSADIARYKKTYARFENKERHTRDFVARKATLA